MALFRKTTRFSSKFSAFLADPPKFSSFLFIEKTQKKAERKTEKRESVCRLQEKIHRRDPEQEQKEKRADRQHALCAAHAHRSRTKALQHPAAVKGADREQIQKAKDEGRAGENRCVRCHIPEKSRCRRADKARDRSCRRQQPFLTVR